MARETRQPVAFAITFVVLGLATIAVFLRIALRVRLGQFHLDDVLTITAWTISVAQAAVATVWMKVTWYGYRTRDIPMLSLQDKIFADKVFFTQGLLYNPVLGLVKWSIIIFLMRLEDRRKTIKWTLRGLLAFNLAHMISVFLVVVFQCSPVHMYWDHHKTDKVVDGQIVNENYSCIHQASFSLSTAAIAVLTDIAILLVPIAMMWKLRMPLRRKLAVVFVLSLGWVVAIIGIIRIKFFIDFWYGRFPDPSWSMWHTLSGVENNVAIMVSCGPALKAGIARFFPRLFGTSTGSRPTGNVYHTRGDHELNSRPHTNRKVPDPSSVNLGKGESTETIIRNLSLGGSGERASGSENGKTPG